MIKSVLKTTVAVATLMVGSNVWGAGTWIDTLNGQSPTGTVVPTTELVSYHLTAGTSTVQSLAVAPTLKTAAKKMLVSMGAQSTAAPTNGLTFTPSTSSEVYLNCALATANDILKFNLSNGVNPVKIYLESGRYDFNSTSGASTGPVTVYVKDDVTLTLANEALKWNYIVSNGKTATLSAATTITGACSGAGGKITTAAAVTTITLK